MQIRLTRKLAESIDGVDLSHDEVGKVIDVPLHDAQMLIAEGWGSPAETAADRARRPRKRADDVQASARKSRKPPAHRR
jgi:hypothetical protein